ncbi:CoA transferase [Pseudoxanthomonas yeongjuensis]|uniref:CaiB/BaiF CoA transferase family protein n=1 Tax=Pseudoxanthomonas yeongjuensis TaxID=377616 RepID=UPI001391F11D|nr:CoA transferase [Pseudoxanthomonas yeongjuensis]KAF1716034.1 CoA transferase [Pseudoxanthomonas yeongjuensis]
MKILESAGAPAAAPRRGPLHGLVVLDITRVVAGPYCSMILADLGARVIKIEHPEDPDYVRDFPPFVGEGDERFSAFFAQYNRHKEGITLNLKHEDGRALLKRLAARADVLVENFRPGTMQRFGVGYETLRAENPKLVYAAISGFGQTGPNALRPGFDNSGQATGGLWSMNGFPDRPPVRVGTIVGDVSATLFATIGVLAAIREVERTGQGQMVDVSQQDSVLALTENAVVKYTVDGEIAGPLGNDHPFVRPYGQFPCKDGHVFFGGYNDKLWGLSCRKFGTPELIVDPEIDTMAKRFDPEVYARRIKPVVEAWFQERSKAELEALAGDDIPLCAVKNIKEVVEDPHIAARDMIVDVDYPQGRVGMFGTPIKLSGTPADARGTAPRLGQHNAEVYADLLGIDSDELQRLKTSGAV